MLIKGHIIKIIDAFDLEEYQVALMSIKEFIDDSKDVQHLEDENSRTYLQEVKNGLLTESGHDVVVIDVICKDKTITAEVTGTIKNFASSEAFRNQKQWVNNLANDQEDLDPKLVDLIDENLFDLT